MVYENKVDLEHSGELVDKICWHSHLHTKVTLLTSKTGVNPRETVRFNSNRSILTFLCTVLHYLALHEHSFDLVTFNARKISFLPKKSFEK
jgi:hypothetical protein